MGQAECTVCWLAKEDRRCSWETAGPSGGHGWAGPEAAPGWGVQGVLAASGGSAHRLSAGSPGKSQGTCNISVFLSLK